MLPALEPFKEFAHDFGAHAELWREIFDSAEPHRIPLPGRWAESLSRLEQLLVLRCLRFDKVVPLMQDFVAAQLGQRFIEPQTANLSLVFPDSTPSSPLIFVLSDGTDPASDLCVVRCQFYFIFSLTDLFTQVQICRGNGVYTQAGVHLARPRPGARAQVFFVVVCVAYQLFLVVG
jgi:hypothetical protein